jgi:hypothetical protein
MTTPMYTEEQEQKFVDVLKGIQAGIPKSLLANTLEVKKRYPDVEKVMLEAVQTESIPLEKRQQIQNMIDTGMFSKTSVQENTKISRMVDDYVTREIKKAQKAGKLPPKSKMKYLPSLMKIRNEN